MREESFSITSSQFLLSCFVPEIFAIKVGSCAKSAQICMFLDPKIFRGGPPEFLDLHYKAHPDSDHVAKFRGDRLTELGDPVVK